MAFMMEALGKTIASSCPAAFSGASGALFVNAVTAVIAAHCGILSENQWPKDNSQEILQNVHDGLAYDFIVVGAGTAGSIVASGLSNQFPSRSVLLIEAGENPGLDSEIPAFLFLNQNQNIDWNYKTNPDNRSCLGFKSNSCIWSKGRAMGGSSSINAMLYIRGHPDDYDKWYEAGAKGWSYADLKPYFKKIEDKLQLEKCQGQDNPWDITIRTAWNQLGFESNDSKNEASIGTKKIKLLTRDGKRLNTAKIYLKEKSNLHVMKNTLVNKIIINATSKTLYGVEILHASGISANISVKKEVILSAGSIATPHILMLSGIGLNTNLEAIGIKCLANLSVGQNLQDHVILPIFLQTDLDTQMSSQELLSFMIQYMLTRTGPFSNIGITDFMGFINTGNFSNYPDIQFHFTYFVKNDKFMLAPYLKGVGYRDEIIQAVINLNKESDLLGMYPTLIHPKSRGEILLPNTKSKLTINSNYFKDPDDLETLMKAINFIRKLANTNSFRSLGVKLVSLKIPGCLKYSEASTNYWECYVRHMATTIYHPVGTAKMSPRSDEGVVNENLLVHGFSNLRVVDASIMPTIPSSNTMAPTMVIAEKAVDIIARHYRDRSEL